MSRYIGVPSVIAVAGKKINGTKHKFFTSVVMYPISKLNFY